MKSGIYKLTFPSGNCYIGKSINIPTRWIQHLDKLSKGNGAKPMQKEFDKYKEYRQEIIYECHEDHIDFMEAFFISTMDPSTSLNTSLPPYPFPGRTQEDVDILTSYLRLSTFEHTLLIRAKDDMNTQLHRSLCSLQKELVAATKKRSAEDVRHDLDNELEQHKDYIEVQEEQIASMFLIQDDLRKQLDIALRPWWKRWFS